MLLKLDTSILRMTYLTLFFPDGALYSTVFMSNNHCVRPGSIGCTVFVNTDLVEKESERFRLPARYEQQGGQSTEITEQEIREEV